MTYSKYIFAWSLNESIVWATKRDQTYHIYFLEKYSWSLGWRFILMELRHNILPLTTPKHSYSYQSYTIARRLFACWCPTAWIQDLWAVLVSSLADSYWCSCVTDKLTFSWECFMSKYAFRLASWMSLRLCTHICIYFLLVSVIVLYTSALRPTNESLSDRNDMRVTEIKIEVSRTRFQNPINQTSIKTIIKT